MDPLRSDLLACAQSLLRLAIRCRVRLASVPALAAASLTVRDLQPASPWLDASAANGSLSSVPGRAVDISERLLAIVRDDAPIDARRAALLMQWIAGDAIAFSSQVRAFAARHGIQLAEHVRGEPDSFAAIQSASAYETHIVRRG